MPRRMSSKLPFLLLSPLGAIVLLTGHLSGSKAPQIDWDAPAEARSVKNPVQASKPSIAAGQDLFKQNCAMCHGETGVGDGPMGLMIGIKANLTDAQRLGKQADGELFWKISKGRDPMPATDKKLSEQERWNLVNYVRTLSKKPGK